MRLFFKDDVCINQLVFFELLQAGLWEREVRLLAYEGIVFNEVFQLAQDQAVVGLVTAGLERVSEKSIPKEIVLQCVGQTLQLEQRNLAMNHFISKLVERMTEVGLTPMLVKGQGIAQCYEKPLWRAHGDIDFLLDEENYLKAVDLLLPFSSGNKPEGQYSKHLGMSIDEWYVELHGTLRSGLSFQVDKEIDAVQDDTFTNNHFRTWKNGEIDVLLPSPDNDVFFVFTHFVKHFYKEGLGLKQLCDWCRLLWTYRDSLDIHLLESRVLKAGLMSEWKSFAAMAVDYLGMSAEAMPFYSVNKKWSRKADKIVAFVLKEGKWNKWRDTLIAGSIFPFSVLRFAPGILLNVNWLKIRERLFRHK